MITKTSISVLLSTLVMALSSNIAIAADKTGSSSPIAAWPLILFFVIIIIFRKKIFAEATPEPEHQEPVVEKKTVEPKTAKPVTAKQEVVKKEKPAKKPVSKTKAKASSTIDLTDDGKQCQASTAKGSRCKRTTTLENITTTVDGKSYKLTVCSQHNNDKLKIFSELIK